MRFCFDLTLLDTKEWLSLSLFVNSMCNIWLFLASEVGKTEVWCFLCHKALRKIKLCVFVSAPACSLHAIQSRRYRNGTSGASPSLISQEHLVRKAASLCYLLSNEFTVSLVSNCINCPGFVLLVTLKLQDAIWKCHSSGLFPVSAVWWWWVSMAVTHWVPPAAPASAEWLMLGWASDISAVL